MRTILLFALAWPAFSESEPSKGSPAWEAREKYNKASCAEGEKEFYCQDAAFGEGECARYSSDPAYRFLASWKTTQRYCLLVETPELAEKRRAWLARHPERCLELEPKLECSGKSCLRYKVDRTVYEYWPRELDVYPGVGDQDPARKRYLCRKVAEKEGPRAPPRPLELGATMALMLLVESLIGFVLGLKARREQLTLFCVNAATIPLLFLITRWTGAAAGTLGLLACAIMIEAAAIQFVLKRSAPDSFLIAAGANLASSLAAVAFLWR